MNTMHKQLVIHYKYTCETNNKLPVFPVNHNNILLTKMKKPILYNLV